MRGQLKSSSFPLKRLLATRHLEAVAVASMAALAALFLALTILGVIQYYSPVPFWDMWDSYLGTYLRVTSGELGTLWERHNEARIVLPKLLYLIDLAYFRGLGKFLLAANVVFLLLICGVMLLFARRLIGPMGVPWFTSVVFSSAAILCFSWIQQDNLTWGFQSMMFLSVLLPLSALYCFALAVEQDDWRWVVLACGLAVGAGLSMINGLAVLPLMGLLGLLLRLQWRKVVFVWLSAAVLVALYGPDRSVASWRIGLQPSEQSDSLFRFTEFVLKNLGGPAYFASGKSLLALLAGVAVVLITVVVALLHLRQGLRHQVCRAVLLGFVAFGLVTAAGVALARVAAWGVDYGLTSRYMTAVVAMWAAIAILVGSFASTPRLRWVYASIAGLLSASLLPAQSAALNPPVEYLRDRVLAALALELEVYDEEILRKLRSPPSELAALAKVPSQRHMSIFGSPEIINAKDLLGSLQRQRGIECVGDLTSLRTLATDPRFMRVEGWLMDEHAKRAASSIFLLDLNRHVVGFAIGGYHTGAFDGRAANARFKGYVLAKAASEELNLKGRDVNCEVRVDRANPNMVVPEPHSDQNWVEGVARGWAAAFFLKRTPEHLKAAQGASSVLLGNGEVRMIQRVDITEATLIIQLEGAPLNGELVGFPHKMELLP